jgi:hypothetical protein
VTPGRPSVELCPQVQIQVKKTWLSLAEGCAYM